MIHLSEKIADYTLRLKYEDLSPEVVHVTKRLLLDSLGCAIGGYPSKSSRIIQQLLKEMGGPAESTVIGSGIRTSCSNSTLANGVMVRYLDFMDTQWDWRKKVLWPQPGHPADGTIPPALAVGEKVQASGRDVITAIALGYEVLGRLREMVNLYGRGWHYSTLNAFSAPVIAGKLLGLNRKQIVHSLGISGCRCGALQVLGATGVPFYMARNLAPAWATQNGVFATLLAQKGFTGPVEIFEGHQGFFYSFVGGDYDAKPFQKGGTARKILEDNMKFYPVNYSLQTTVAATTGLIKDHKIKASDIEGIRIRICRRQAEHAGDPVKRFPEDKETADHSMYFVTAVTIVDGEITPRQFTTRKLKDPVVRQLINKITVEADPQLEGFYPEKNPVIVEIKTKSGTTYSNRVDLQKGAFQNPMTEDELKTKVRGLASGIVSKRQTEKIIETVYNLDEIGDIGKLMKLMVFK